MIYKKCQRCQLNYVTSECTYCKICLEQLSGKKDDFDDVQYDVCPFCEKRVLTNGEEMCQKCLAKKQKGHDDVFL